MKVIGWTLWALAVASLAGMGAVLVSDFLTAGGSTGFITTRPDPVQGGMGVFLLVAAWILYRWGASRLFYRP